MKVLFMAAAVAAYKQPVSIGEALRNINFVATEESKWGEVDPEDTIEAHHHRYYRHTNVEEYKRDGPGAAYEAIQLHASK